MLVKHRSITCQWLQLIWFGEFVMLKDLPCWSKQNNLLPANQYKYKNVKILFCYFISKNEVIVIHNLWMPREYYPWAASEQWSSDILFKNYGFRALLEFQFRLANRHFLFVNIPFDASWHLFRQFLFLESKLDYVIVTL